MDDTLPLKEVWARTFNQVKQDVDLPTVWLTMQAVQPIAIDEGRFIATIPPDLRYLSMNLEGSDILFSIEHALQDVAGYPLAFTLISGDSLADWEFEKAKLLIEQEAVHESWADPDSEFETDWPTSTVDSDTVMHEQAPNQPAFTSPVSQSTGAESFESWAKLGEHVTQFSKNFPMIRYPHGQARYLLHCARVVSDTMDRLGMVANNPEQERQLSRIVDRIAAALTLDPFFVGLEIMRYRQVNGREEF